MTGLLETFSISTNVCANSTQAIDNLSQGSTDLLIVDWGEDSEEILHHVRQSRILRKPTIMVVSELASAATGTYFLLHKPVKIEDGTQRLKQAYSRMLQDHRQHTRYTLMSVVIATRRDGWSIPITVTNIGEGGIGLSTKELLVRGDVLSFPLRLPDTDIPIHIEARVLWARQYGAVGCEFVDNPATDFGVLNNWLKHKCQVKKLMVELWQAM